MAKKEVTVRSVIDTLRSHLYDKFEIHDDLLNRCQGNLLERGTVSKLRPLLRNGRGSEALTELLRYMEGFYIMETLEKFVDLLQELSQTHPAYGKIAEEFNRVMGRSMYSSCKLCRCINMLYIVCLMHDHWRYDDDVTRKIIYHPHIFVIGSDKKGFIALTSASKLTLPS